MEAIDWSKQPFKAALSFAGNKKKAIEALNMAKEISGTGFIENCEQKYHYK